MVDGRARNRGRTLACLGLMLCAVSGASCSIDFDRFRGPDARDGSLPDGGAPDAIAADAPDGAVVAPAVPLLLFPFNGWLSGSAHATVTTAAHHPLRPRLRWREVPGATRYHLQVGSECAGFPLPCDVGGLAIDETTVIDTEHTPDEPLGVDTTPPVGRRYYWRVRACDGDACSSWSQVRYLDAGRLRSDFDGDGYSDLLVGVPRDGMDRGQALVYRGGPSGLSDMPATTLSPPGDATASTRFGSSVAALGDVNGDGFADAAIGTSDGRAIAFRGSATGLAATGTELRMANGSPVYSETVIVSGAGDLNGDGHADLLAGAVGFRPFGESTPTGAAFVLYGSDGFVAAAEYLMLSPATRMATDMFGSSVAGVGDIDGDGYADLAVAAIAADLGRTDVGAVYVYRGADMPRTTEHTTLQALSPMTTGFFGSKIAGGGDVDGDGFSDIVVGSLGQDVDGVDTGQAYVFFGTANGLPAPSGMPARSPDVTLDCPAPENGAAFGNGVALEGDLNGDGLADLAVAATHISRGSMQEGNVFLYDGAAPRPPPAALVLDNPLGHIQARFGEVLVAYSDYDGDGFYDLAVSARLQGDPAETRSDSGSVYVYYGSADLFPPTDGTVRTDADVSLDNPSGLVDTWFGASIARAFSPRASGRTGSRS